VLTGPLEVQDGEATFRFPLVVAPRYTAGSPLSGDQTGSGVGPDTDAVPDASRVTPPRLEPTDVRPQLDITVSVEGAGLALSDLRTSLHANVIAETVEGKTVLKVQPGDRADRDFLLRFRVDRARFATSAVVVADDREGTDEGTWTVTVIPPPEVASEPRDVVVVLDRSGSMGGWKMVAARRAAGRIVDMLDVGDRFCVLGFDTVVERPKGWPALVEATDRNRFAAASWLGSLEARGGTEMAQPLVEAAALLARSQKGRRAVLVLVTDGQITGEDHLLRSLQPRLGAVTIHCVGVDRAVNAGFLDRLARQGGGRFELVESEDRLDEVMAALARTIGRPALTGISIAGCGIDIDDTSITPAPAPDAFAGVPCVLSGRYRGPVDRDATITASAVGGEHPFSVTLVPLRSTAAAVRTIWARAALRDLEDAYASGHDRDDKKSHRIVEHSLRFGVLSRFTAFVAVDPERTDGETLDEVVQPVEPTSGWAVLTMNRPRLAVSEVAMAPPPSGNADVGASAWSASLWPIPSSSPAPRFRGSKSARASRSLDEVLRTLEELLTDAHVAVDRLAASRDEVVAFRDSSEYLQLSTLLARLCEAIEAYIALRSAPIDADRKRVATAVEAVRAAMLAQTQPARRSTEHFWE
jgi:hypothetical protein